MNQISLRIYTLLLILPYYHRHAIKTITMKKANQTENNRNTDLKLFNRGRPASFATSQMVDREDKRTNNRKMIPAQKNNAAAGYQGPVKIELLKGAGLLFNSTRFSPLAKQK